MLFRSISEKCEASFQIKILKSLNEHHDKNPVLAEGLETSELMGKLGLSSKQKTGKLYLDLLLAKLKSSGLIDQYKATWIMFGHKPKLDEKTLIKINWLENRILAFGDEKPVMADIESEAQEQNISKANVRLYLAYLANTGKIRFFDDDIIHTSIVDQFRIELLKALNQKNGNLTIPEFKTVVSGTKKQRALLGEIFEAEKLIRFTHGDDIETRIEMTQKGKDFIDAYLSK